MNEIEGKWIQGKNMNYGEDSKLYYQKNPNILLKHSFMIPTQGHAIFRIACLGYYIVYINGKRVGNDELNNDWTNYQKCVYYETYDVSNLLKDGDNEIVIELGNGMYNPAPLKLFGKYNLREKLKEIGQPQVICDLSINAQLVFSSDENWQYSYGNIIFNNLYLGETVDLTKKDYVFYPVITSENKRKFKPSFIPKIKKFQKIKPQNIQNYEKGILLDFKEMISGMIEIDINAKENQKIILRYSENCQDNQMDYTSSLAGSVGEQINNFMINGGKGCPEYAIQTDTLICHEGINHFENKFTYHSFRYIYIEGCQKEDIINILAVYVHTDLKQIGFISTDHDFYNELYDVALRTKLNNVHSVFEDCARERLGYGGDIVALAMSNLYTFDLITFYKKIIYDFRYEQTENGGVPETAPYVGIQSNGTANEEGPLLWQLVYPYLTYKHYQFYGDIILLKEEYPYLKKQLDYLLSISLDEVVHHCLGDHGSILIAGEFRKPTPDKLLLGYCTILLFLRYNILIGQAIEQDVSSYQQKYDQIKDMTIQKFQNDDGSFGEGTQSGYAFAIMLELEDEKTLCQKFLEKIKSDQGILNSGIFGMAFTYEILAKYGYNEVIENWLFQDSDISFKKMLSNGNKALAELFIGQHYSLNHAMFASYQQWYYEGLAGIQIQDNAVGFDKIKLRPYFSKKMNHCDCCIDTKHGKLMSSWQRKNNLIQWTLQIPKGIDYEIIVDRKYHQEIKENQMIMTMEG